MLRVSALAMTESEKRSRLDKGARERPGLVFYAAWIVVGPTIVYLVLSLVAQHIFGVRAGTFHIVLLLVLIGVGLLVATVFRRLGLRISDRLLKRFMDIPMHEEIAAPYLADAAAGAWDVWEMDFDRCWIAASHDKEAAAVLLRVGPDRFVYLNTPSLWDVMKKDGSAIRERLVVLRGRGSAEVYKMRGEGEWMPVVEKAGAEAPTKNDSEILTLGELPESVRKRVEEG